MMEALKQAMAKGLSGPLLEAIAASGDLETAQEFAALSRKQIAHEERLYNQRARATGDLGEFASQKVYGERVKEQTHQVRLMRRDIARQTRIIARQERLLEHAVERGANKGTKAGVQRQQHRARTARAARR